MDCLTLEDWTNRLSRNGGNLLPVYTAQHHRRANVSLFSDGVTDYKVEGVTLYTTVLPVETRSAAPVITVPCISKRLLG